MATNSPFSLDTLLSGRLLEDAQLELKADWDEHTEPAVFRTICAFANDLHNLNGGVVLIGVEEGSAGQPPRVRGLAQERVEGIQRELLGVQGAIRPEYTPRLELIRVGERVVLVLRCPPGEGRPYSCRKGGRGADANEREVWVRQGSSTIQAKGEVLRQLNAVSARTPFDDQTAFDLRVEQLSPDRVAQHVGAVSAELARPEYTLAERLRRLDLSRRVNGHEAPVHAAALFFLEEASARYRGAQVELVRVAQGGDRMDEWTVKGPLPHLVRETLSLLDAHNPERVVKHPDWPEARRTRAWPPAALDEVIVNAVHHRGYEAATPDPIQVELHPDRLVVTSYPGPVPGLTRESLESGKLTRPPSRNRRLAELLREAGLAEARRTGLEKLRRVLRENGNPPPIFDFDEPGRTYFTVELPIHPDLREALEPADVRRGQPLRLGRPAPPEEVLGREGLVARILRALERSDVVLVGPPGRGVSSVLGLVAARASAGRPVFALDLDGVEDAEGVRDTFRIWAEEQGLPLGALAAGEGRLGPFCKEHGVLVVLDHVEASLALVSGSELVWALEGAPGMLLGASYGALSWGRSSAPRETVALPPLGVAETQELASRLLLGQGLREPQALAARLGELSAGNPGVLAQLVHRVVVNGGEGVKQAQEAWDQLLGLGHDPAGLQARDRNFDALLRTPDPLARQLLGLASQDSLTRLDLIARCVSPTARRVDVLSTLTALLEQGFLVERDGRVALEYPLLAETFRSWDAREHARWRKLADEDIPF